MKPEVIKQILFNEFSSFNQSGFDTDIKTYITLIDDKKYRQAASFYEKQIVPKYPDEYLRVKMIRYYRKNDLRFDGIYMQAVRQIFDKVVVSVKQIIFYLSDIFKDSNNDPYQLLRKIENALKYIPGTGNSKPYFLEKLKNYSVLLGYMQEEFSAAFDILERYFDNTLFVKIEIPIQKEEKETELKPEIEESQKPVTIDLDKIEFSSEDIKQICINSNIESRTAQTLSYCRLYWRQIFNADFEKKIFLYSKKYNTNHYKIFTIIKNSRIRKSSDDVILLEIYSILANGYQYFIQDDLLMQAVWRKIKPIDISGIGNNYETPEDDQDADNEETAEKRYFSENANRSAERKNRSRIKSAPPTLQEKVEKYNNGAIFNSHLEFENILPRYVEKYLLRHRKKKTEKDPYILKGAVYIVVNYIMDNYTESYLGWDKSLAKMESTKMGFRIPEIDTILKNVFEDIKSKRRLIKK